MKWICYYTTTAGEEKYKIFDDMNTGLEFYENKYNTGLPCLFMRL